MLTMYKAQHKVKQLNFKHFVHFYFMDKKSKITRKNIFKELYIRIKVQQSYDSVLYDDCSSGHR